MPSLSNHRPEPLQSVMHPHIRADTEASDRRMGMRPQEFHRSLQVLVSWGESMMPYKRQMVNACGTRFAVSFNGNGALTVPRRFTSGHPKEETNR